MRPGGAVLALVLAIWATGCTGGDGEESSSGAAPQDSAAVSTSTGSVLVDVSALVDAVTSSVVVVDNLVTDDDGASDELSSQGTGSGVVVDNNGGVVTNLHVIAGADRITVQTRDGRRRSAEVVASLGDSSDLALLRVNEREGLVPAAFGDSYEMEVGEGTVVVGNPVGIGLSAATGILSARGRVIETPDALLYDVLQTDAAVNPGNSGGALLNARGELIGINTAVRQETEGIGFAIRVEQVEDFLTATDAADPIPHIGAGFATMDQQLLDSTDIDLDAGVGVLAVLPGGPADNAGLAADDIIVEIDGTAVTTATDAHERVAASTPGEVLTLRVVRQTVDEDQTLDLEITTGALQPETTAG